MDDNSLFSASFTLHPSSFLQRVFEAQEKVYSDPIEALICEEHVAFCNHIDSTKIQESASWRKTYLAREIAKIVIDEKAEINRRALFSAIEILTHHHYCLGPERHHDAQSSQHLLKILKLFYTESDYVRALKRIYAPYGHQNTCSLIRETLFLPHSTRITDMHARQAAFCALLCSLRQNVGSCFATAPAILIQQDQPLQFLADMSQLFGTGRLTRIYGGVEYTAPLSSSWGVGDLFRPFLFSSLGADPFKALSCSPGLQAAFDAAGLIDKKSTQEEKEQKCSQLLRGALSYVKSEDMFFFITPEQIIKAVLLQNLGISEEDVNDFKKSSSQVPFAHFVIQAPSVQSEKSRICSRYLKDIESAKSAFKALTDNPILKAWEFTLASLSEAKADTAKWNLYISLGVQFEDPHGIGQCLYEVIQKKIDSTNQRIQELQSGYDHLFAQAKYLEGRIRRSDEKQRGWVEAEYHICTHEIQRALDERDFIYEKGRKLQGIYPLLVDFYGQKIRDYFQEVYDAEMHDVSTNPYDDSPAGFRLMYKHGRAHTDLWTMINTSSEYLQHLTSFFISTEVDINQLEQFAGLEKEISELITAAILTIKRPEFLESSLFRLARAYHEQIVADPLKQLDQVKRKPWSYISGGSMSTLISNYWGIEQRPKEVKRWVESENELLAFLIDSMKECSLSVQRRFQQAPNLSMLAFSPTHAFLCKPGWTLFRKAWESDIYTYTWIRDHWMAPQQRFLDSILLDLQMMETIVNELLLIVPTGYRPIVKNALRSLSFSMTPPEFRKQVLTILSYEKWLVGKSRIDLIAEELDSILYRFLPLFPGHALKDKLKELFDAIDELSLHQRQELLHLSATAQEHLAKYITLTAEDLKNIAKGLLILALKSTRSSFDYHQKIVHTMQRLQLCFPEPILVADTNWEKNTFGFVVGPGTRQLEFWRFDFCGSTGRPITQWKRYLNGTAPQEWGLYPALNQYNQQT